ncbi:thioredoxin family protein [Gangjinia marincola]|uniref:Thioredoxin family protein n=1 Tax=Gangjinia marincola TaxID=578463 RepID=A0ABP3XUM4_9FLAO
MKFSKLLFALVVVGIISVVAMAANLVASDDISTFQGYKVGDKATDFSLKNIDGSMVSLADYPEAKGFIVIFTTNHCPYAVLYEDRIIALDQQFKKKGYPVIAINPNDTPAYPEDSYKNMKVRAKEKGFTFPYLFDKGQNVYPQYGATKTPHTYVLQKQGDDLLVKYIGAIDNNYKDAADATEFYVQDAVNALLSNKKIDVQETKAIGCSIKKA